MTQPTFGEKAHAIEMDRNNPLHDHVGKFTRPLMPNGKPALYGAHHSLATKPQELPEHDAYLHKVWPEMAVRGHFADDVEGGGWFMYDEKVRKVAKKIFGAAKLTEVGAPGGDLSTNLDRLIRAFYAPTAHGPHQILAFDHRFPSDESLVRNAIENEQTTRTRLGAPALPKNPILGLQPENDQLVITEQQILQALQDNRDSIALVVIPQVDWITGAAIDANRIAIEAHRLRPEGPPIHVVIDAAHAAINYAMDYYKYGPDASVVAGYKEIGAGPGQQCLVYVNDRHGELRGRNVSRGWCAYERSERFSNDPKRPLRKGVGSLRLGNPDIASLSILVDVLNVIEEAGGPQAIIDGTEQLVDYFLELIRGELDEEKIQIITPSNPKRRGAMIAFKLRDDLVESTREALEQHNTILDFRGNTLRLSLSGLRSTFTDAWEFAQVFKKIFA